MRKQNAFTLIELLVVIAIIAILAAILFPVFAQARAKARAASCLSNEKQMGGAFSMYVQDYDEGYPFWNEAAQLGLAVETSSSTWDAKLLPYVKNGNPGQDNPKLRDYGGVWHCPDSEAPANYRSYGMSYGFAVEYDPSDPRGIANLRNKVLTLAQIELPATFVTVGDSGPNLALPPAVDNSGNGGLLNVGYCLTGYYQYYGLTNPNGCAIDRERPYRHQGGANYLFSEGHAKYYKAEVMFPHPAPKNIGTLVDEGNATCAMANYMMPTAADRLNRQARAVTYGYTSCKIDH